MKTNERLILSTAAVLPLLVSVPAEAVTPPDTQKGASGIQLTEQQLDGVTAGVELPEYSGGWHRWHPPQGNPIYNPPYNGPGEVTTMALGEEGGPGNLQMIPL
ncbi:hypothetical protein [Methylococcus sp. Mc7]|jgi:hypothetical protein|uniref:hypothetical protein n=1 Tax=Methylococcus sp. Mc7 TaxID=2860258 RepID=UPI001C52DF37|nr:hypothetical protein [Methylococcus sp. Mc7]QXP83387.1 hypothetical protein KW115_14595 [Methylococcus sp. Mc7]